MEGDNKTDFQKQSAYFPQEKLFKYSFSILNKTWSYGKLDGVMNLLVL